MERPAELRLEKQLNRDACQAIFLLTLLNSIRPSARRETKNYSQDVHTHNRGPLRDLGPQDLSGIAEIS